MKKQILLATLLAVLVGCVGTEPTSLSAPALKAGTPGLETYSTTQTLPAIQESSFGSYPGNSSLPTNWKSIYSGIATNLVLNKIATNNTELVKVIRIIEMQDYLWDPVTEILYKREINNNRLYYIAVTNVDLRAQGIVLP